MSATARLSESSSSAEMTRNGWLMSSSRSHAGGSIACINPGSMLKIARLSRMIERSRSCAPRWSSTDWRSSYGEASLRRLLHKTVSPRAPRPSRYRPSRLFGRPQRAQRRDRLGPRIRTGSSRVRRTWQRSRASASRWPRQSRLTPRRPRVRHRWRVGTSHGESGRLARHRQHGRRRRCESKRSR